MALLYLDFDFSDEESGRGSFDAMASVMPDRLPALLDEIARVLRWAMAAFGPCDAALGEGEWDYALHGVVEPGRPLNLVLDEAEGRVTSTPAGGSARRTVSLTLSGSAAFCSAFREAFDVDG